MKNINSRVFFGMIMALFMGACMQLSYTGDMGEKEKKGEEENEVRVKRNKILFLKKYSHEGEERTTEIFSLDVKKGNIYVRPEKPTEGYIAFTQEDFRSLTQPFPFIKFFGNSENEMIAQDAVREFKENMSAIQKRPGVFAFLVGSAAVTTTAAVSMLLK